MSVKRDAAIKSYKIIGTDLNNGDYEVSGDVKELRGVWPDDEINRYNAKATPDEKIKWFSSLTRPEDLGRKPDTDAQQPAVKTDNIIIDSGSGISEASAYMKLVSSNDLAVAIVKALFAVGGIGESRNVKEWTSALTVLSSACQQLEPGKIMGAATKVDDLSFNRWKDSNNKGVVLAGPYLAQKFFFQHGVEHKMWESKERGSWLEWKRYGVTLGSDSRYAIYNGSFADNDVDKQPYDAEKFKIFLKDFKLSNKTVKYSPIPIWAYNYAMLFVCCYDVRAKDGKINVSLRMKDTPDLNDEAVKYMEHKKKAFHDTVVVMADADWILEVIARGMMGYGMSPDVDIYIKKSFRSIENTYETWQAVFDTTMLISDGKPEDIALAKKNKLVSLGGTVDIGAAIAQVKAARENFRNTSQVSQLVNQNVGSVGADCHIQPMETRMKGRRMMDLASKLGYKQDTDVHMYGVMYNHMEPEFRMDGVKVLYHDVAAAKKGVADAVYGDIFQANGEVIFDDTLVKEVPPTHFKKADAVYTPDHAKLEHFFTNCRQSKLIISKINLYNFSKQDQILELTRFAENLDNKVFNHIQIVKLGKLHNAEAFFIMSNLGTVRFPVRPTKEETMAGKKAVSLIRGDLMQCALCISLANEIVQKSQVYGLRATKVGKVNGSMSKMWRSLVASLPSRWTWYFDQTAPPMEGGSYMTTNYVPDDLLSGATAFGFEYDNKGLDKVIPDGF